MISKKYSTDISFKLNEEFDFHHPILKECVKVICVTSFVQVNS